MIYNSIGGSVVECSPATRAARVRFPADAYVLLFDNGKHEQTDYARSEAVLILFKGASYLSNVLLYILCVPIIVNSIYMKSKRAAVTYAI